jgi:putative transposase
MRTRRYPSDLTEEQWALVKSLIHTARPGGRPGKTAIREVINAILSLRRTGCQWRFLPQDFPAKSTVWQYYNAWRRDGTLHRIHAKLREQVRRRHGRKRTPAAASIDSPSVPSTEGGQQRG